MKLSTIETGEATAAEAAEALRAHLEAASPKAMRQAYVALRAWTWKALRDRRADDELREWYGVIRRSAAVVEAIDCRLSGKIEALAELIHESITVSRLVPVWEAMQKRHVQVLLRVLEGAEDGRLNRSELVSRLGLQQANLTRVINLAAMAGLVSRTFIGREVAIEATKLGLEQVRAVEVKYPAMNVGRADVVIRDVFVSSGRAALSITDDSIQSYKLGDAGPYDFLHSITIDAPAAFENKMMIVKPSKKKERFFVLAIEGKAKRAEASVEISYD